MLSPYDFAPRVYATSFGSWADVARAYQARARPKAQTDRQISALTQQIVQGTESDLERARRIYLWITSNIRYLGVFSASGGYVPVAAAQVLKDRYGDCKGHATLFEAMLRSVGIESSQVLINTEMSYQWPELPIYGAFDHVITYIPALKMYLDSTSRFVRFGSLHSSLEGKPLLLTASVEVANTGLWTPTNDRTVVQTHLRLLPDGRVVGQSLSLLL
ncbi:MAG: transglutaminase-like domain-containing protein [Alphaproteobacteria bacterium]|nr:transglutaminase-like domain-containing protein [Alphaproteobacteria bacterium]